MNDKAYDPDRSLIAPYGLFMVALVRVMHKMKRYTGETVYRGVKRDLCSDYQLNCEFTWYGFCSTAKSIDVLNNPLFCGETGLRTMFAIKLTQHQARDITRYSLVAAEDEVLLPPGCRFKVTAVLPQGELTIIQIEELPSDEWIFDLRDGAIEQQPAPPPSIVAGGSAGGSSSTFEFGELMKQLELAESDAPEIQPALKEHGLLSVDDVVEFLTAECGGVPADGLKLMGIKVFGTRKRVLQALLKKQPPAEAAKEMATFQPHK